MDEITTPVLPFPASINPDEALPIGTSSGGILAMKSD